MSVANQSDLTSRAHRFARTRREYKHLQNALVHPWLQNQAPFLVHCCVRSSSLQLTSYLMLSLPCFTVQCGQHLKIQLQDVMLMLTYYLTIWKTKCKYLYDEGITNIILCFKSISIFSKIIQITWPLDWLRLIFASFDLYASLNASRACRSLAPLKYWTTRRGRQVPVHRPPIVSLTSMTAPTLSPLQTQCLAVLIED